MAVNIPKLQQIHDQITREPDTHDQSWWEWIGDESCGTTRCIAGWALHFHELETHPGKSPRHAQVIAETMVPTDGRYRFDYPEIPNAAKSLLGLTKTTLFYADAEHAVQIIEGLLTGEDENAVYTRVLGE